MKTLLSMVNNMKKSKKKRLAIILLFIAILMFSIAFYLVNNKSNNAPEGAKKEDDITTKEFDYVLYENKSPLYKQYFAKLKEELLKDEINEEEYAKTISQLFAVDFYSLKEKKTNTDVGGLDFIYPSMKDNFVLKATDTIYKGIESNVYGDRRQDLPKVTDTVITTVEKEKIKFDEVSDDNGYKVVMNIEYERNLDYTTEITLLLAHKSKKLYIVEVK